MFESVRRDLAWVPRWGIMRVNRRQSVAEHSYFVTCYGLEIARRIGWPDGYELGLHRALRCESRGDALHLLALYLLRHDESEVIEGDIPGPVKKLISRNTDGLVPMLARRFGEPPALTLDMKAIRWTADRIDEAMYLAGEINSGNQSVRCALEKVRKDLARGVGQLPTDTDTRARLAEDFRTMIDSELAYNKDVSDF